MKIEDEVRTVLRTRAHQVEVPPMAWDSISHFESARPSSTKARLLAGLVAAVIAIGGVAFVLSAFEGDRAAIPSVPAGEVVGRRVAAYEAMIRYLADPQDPGPIYVDPELCSILTLVEGDACKDRLSRAEQEEIVARLDDLGPVVFDEGTPPHHRSKMLLGPIITKADGLRIEGGNVCGGLCGSGSMYRLVPTSTGYEVTGTDDSYGSWIS